MPLFDITENDRKIYETELRDFLPDEIFDVHAHIWRDELRIKHKDEPKRKVTWPTLVAKDDPIEDLAETYRLMFPGKKVCALVFANEGGNERLNDYVKKSSAAAGFPALYFSHPSQSGEEVESRIRDGGFVGIKSYLDLSPSYIPEREIRIFDFFPEKQLEVMNRIGAIVMLHIPRPGRLKDPVNLAQIAEIKEKYVDSLGIDGIMFAPYKFFGVRGSGIGYASERLCRLPHEHLFGEGEQNLTWKLGSPAPAHFAVVTAIVDYVCGIGGNFTDSTDRRELYVAGMHAIRRQELALMDYMLDGDAAHPGLRRIPSVKVLFDKAEPGSRDFIVGMTLDGWEHAEAVREYEKRGIIVYERVASSIYSVRMLNSFGIDGCIRVSPLHCNTKEEIAEFLDVTSELAGMKS